VVKPLVAVVFGGASVEREVSVRSARTLLANIPAAKYALCPVAIDESGSFHAEEESRRILAEGLGSVKKGGTRFGESLLKGVDVVFPIVHGEAGEDGTLQGYFETLGLPFVGSGVAASALGMNKAAFRARIREAGLPVVRSMAILRRDWQASAAKIEERAEEFSFPVFVKPSNGGSSLGVSKVKTREAMKGAIDLALEYDTVALVEEAIDAREIECAVLGNEKPRASGCGEIVPGREFYDYEDKYIESGARLLIPAPLPPETAEKVRNLALEAFVLCGCSGMARVDFFLDRKSGAVYVSELNTLPGFTSISMYPKLWEHAGLPLPALLDELIRLAFEREKTARVEVARRRPPKRLA
jgi:D-alanine-D-alanine ligase